MALMYLYPLRGLSRLIPVRLMCWLADRLAPLYALLRGDLTDPISQRMVICFAGHNLPAPPRVLARSFVAKDLRKSIDDLVMHRLSTERLSACATVKGMEHLDEALAKGKGVIVISGHFQANRLAKRYLRRIGYSLMSIRTRVPTSNLMGKFGNRFVAPAYGRFLDAVIEDEIHVQDAGLGAGLLRRLRENGMVNIHIDTAITKERIELHYLNDDRWFPTGFLKLAELTGAPILPMNCRGNSSAFEIHFEKPICYIGKSSPEVFRERLKSLATILESWILTHPEEWEVWPRGIIKVTGK